MKKAARLHINLLPKDPFLSSPLGRLLQWSLSIGRYLVIFTELVVIISFATRFNLDRQNTDLNTAILQKQIIIDSYGDLEQQVKDVQKKIESYTQVEQQVNIADAFQALTEVTPQDIKLEELNIQQNTLIFSGQTRSNVSLNLLINNIQLSQKFDDIVVEKIETKSDKDPGFHFRIRANMKRNTVATKTVPTKTSEAETN
jgi:Tfp pilus assembly protein PilN